MRLVKITSWNEYHERTQIEPSYSNDTPDPWLLHNVTREYTLLYKARSSSGSLVFAIMAVITVVFIVSAMVKFVLKLT